MHVKPKMPDTLRTENHDLLISVNGKVDALATTMEKLASHTAGEFDKLWKHTEERDRLHSVALQTTTDKLAASIERVAEKQSNFGKPNISAIVSICVLIGSIAVAFIAPIKADIERSEASRVELAKAVLVKEDKIQALQAQAAEFREKQRAILTRLDDVAANGSGITRERLAVIESDLKWMRGEKRNLSATETPP